MVLPVTSLTLDADLCLCEKLYSVRICHELGFVPDIKYELYLISLRELESEFNISLI